jgi:hypothetical protein
MAGFAIDSIVQTITASGNSGAFDCSQFDSIRVTGTSSATTAINCRVESQQLDGTWVALFGNFLTEGNPNLLVDVTYSVPKTGRIAWDHSADTNLNLSIWGLTNE